MRCGARDVVAGNARLLHCPAKSRATAFLWHERECKAEKPATWLVCATRRVHQLHHTRDQLVHLLDLCIRQPSGFPPGPHLTRRPLDNRITCKRTPEAVIRVAHHIADELLNGFPRPGVGTGITNS